MMKHALLTLAVPFALSACGNPNPAEEPELSHLTFASSDAEVQQDTAHLASAQSSDIRQTNIAQSDIAQQADWFVLGNGNVGFGLPQSEAWVSLECNSTNLTFDMTGELYGDPRVPGGAIVSGDRIQGEWREQGEHFPTMRMRLPKSDAFWTDATRAEEITLTADGETLIELPTSSTLDEFISDCRAPTMVAEATGNGKSIEPLLR